MREKWRFMSEEVTATTGSEVDQHPAAVPWLQALGVVAALITGCLQAFVPEFDPPTELYYLFGAAIVGLDREYTVRILRALRGK